MRPVDSSPYLGVETNDMKYKENLVMMPERMERISNNMVPAINELNKSIQLEIYNKQLHQKVLESMDNSLKLIQEHFTDNLKIITPKLKSIDDVCKPEIVSLISKLNETELDQLTQWIQNTL